jgi:hypothetical protein
VKLVERIEQVLTSAVPSDSAILWTWIHLRGGRAGIGEVLGRFPLRSVALVDLEARKLVSFDGVDVVAAESAAQPPAPGPEPPALRLPSPGRRGVRPAATAAPSVADVAAALAHPKRKASAEVLKKAEDHVFRLYQRLRREHDASPLRGNALAKYRSKWRALVELWVVDGVDLKEYIEFAYKQTRWQGHKFPPPGSVAGDWVRQVWDDKKDGPGSRHAGAAKKKVGGAVSEFFEDVYEDPDGTRFDEDTRRHIEAQARLLMSRPHLYEKDASWDEVIQDLAEWLPREET